MINNPVRRRAALIAATVVAVLAVTVPTANALTDELDLTPTEYPVTRQAGPPISIPAGAGNGYWLVGADGGVFAYGDARFAGSASGITRKPIVGIAKTKSGKGYWLAASDGGVFTFGDAPYVGSLPALINGSEPGRAAALARLTTVGIEAAPSGTGFYLFTSDGGVHTFGAGSKMFGAPASQGPLDFPIVDMAVTSDGNGYWLVDAVGKVYNYGNAPALPFGDTRVTITDEASLVNLRISMERYSDQAAHIMSLGGGIFTRALSPNHAMFFGAFPDADYPMLDLASCGCSGYWQVAADGSVFAHGDARFHGSVPQTIAADDLAGPIVAMIQSGPTE